MNDSNESESSQAISDEAVRAKTGKAWPEWFAILDAAGATNMSHKEIVAYLNEQHGVGPWWQQMVTVTYEQARSLRQKHEMPNGYQISRSKTIAVPLAALYDAWQDEATRWRWLPEVSLHIRKATEGKTMRIVWSDNTTLDVSFYPKGEHKTQVTVQHNKLANAAEAERMKAYWTERLNSLKAILEAG
jgi:hypothetical protein